MAEKEKSGARRENPKLSPISFGSHHDSRPHAEAGNLLESKIPQSGDMASDPGDFFS
jgi:hypothetical protein